MKSFFENTWKHRAHVIMALPAFLVLLFFAYIPMGGLVMAFKSYDYTKGIWGSPWNGFENFKFLIASKSTFLSMTKNTLLYYVIFTGIGTTLNVVLAIAIDQCIFKKCSKAMQTIMIVPVFISYAAVQFIVYAFISTDTGILNNLFGTHTRYYSTASFWPIILTIVKMWNSVGYGSVLYMSVLSGIDSSLYEAAEIDGASKFQIFKSITFPQILLIMAPSLIQQFIGNINNFNVIYFLTGGGPKNSEYYQAGSTDLLVTWLYKLTVSAKDYNLASVIGILIFAISATFSLLAYTRSSSFKEGAAK
mgnify:CR=1 FL=1